MQIRWLKNNAPNIATMPEKEKEKLLARLREETGEVRPGTDSQDAE